MDRCLSTIELEELVAGLLPAQFIEPCETHVAGCARCSADFARKVEVSDADDWLAAAQHVREISESDQAFLDRLKRPSADGAGGNLPAVESDWFAWDSLNGLKHSPALQVRRQQFTPSFPDVPGFEIQAQLGRGGMGVVYKARQTACDRTVALKMISAGQQASAEEHGRFYDEAEAISRLRHPHIVQIFEVGRMDDGRFYFVLEFVEGGTLADRIRQGPLSPRAAAQLLESLARAMHYAHERGIIHRDLKPANVLLHGRKAFVDMPAEIDRQPSDWDFRRFMPKITDFGLAKMLDRGEGHTSSGDVLGTPSYMAPEQAQGLPYAIGPTTDVYSLGAILYEMLTGRPPFQAATPMDTLLQVHTQEVVPPRRITRTIPPKLEAICLKCLRKNPASRYATAEALAEDVRLYLEGQPIQARRRSFLQQRWIDLRQKTGTLFFAALALIMALIAGITIATRGQRDESFRNEARDRRASAAASEIELFHLRLDRALSYFERRETQSGLVELAELLQEAQRRPEWEKFVVGLRRQLSAWSEAAPALQGISPTTAPAAVFEPDSRRLFLAGNALQIWNISDSQSASTVLDLPSRAAALQVQPKGQRAVILTDRELVIGDLGSRQTAARWESSGQPIEAMACSPIDDAIVIGTRDGQILFSDGTLPLKFEPVHKGEPVRALAWSPDGGELLLLGRNGTVRQARLKLWQERELPQHTTAMSIAWSHDSKSALTGGVDGRVYVWRDGRLQTVFPAHDEAVASISVEPTGMFLLTGAGSKAKIWNLQAQVTLAVVAHPTTVRSATFARDGKNFLTIDAAGTARVWSLPGDGARERNLEARSGGIPHADAKSPSISLPPGQRAAATSPSGAECLALDSNGLLRLITAAGASPPLSVPSAAEFRCAGFSEDGTLLVTGFSDSVRLWDAASARQIGPPLSPPPKAHSIEFLDHDRQFRALNATGGRQWRTPSGEPLDWAARVQRQTGMTRMTDGVPRFLDHAAWMAVEPLR